LQWQVRLFVTDPVLQKQGATTTYWKTGHSYMKRRTNELGALAGFEKSGHFFFNKPFGRGFDDGLISAIAVAKCWIARPASRWRI
jgi:phosphomannomutase/phosphoglucomutase